MTHRAFSCMLIAAGLTLAPTAASAQHRTTHAAPHARISMAQARTIALRTAPGRVVKQEYEYEGHGWRYSFDIRQGRRIHEIGVDAQSGRIVENKFETTPD